MFLALLLAAALATSPKPAPPVFATGIYALTFRTPPGSTYCPLPEDWVGSDHGTTVFLLPPRRCRGAGYPSSARGFTPNVPRIDVFYAYAGDNDTTSCRHPIGTIRFVGQPHGLCRTTRGGRVQITVGAFYQSDLRAEVDVTLDTTKQRLDTDMRVFRSLARSLRPCTAKLWDEHGMQTGTIGTGEACPRGGEDF
jgi:hypothetical protein